MHKSRCGVSRGIERKMVPLPTLRRCLHPHPLGKRTYSSGPAEEVRLCRDTSNLERTFPVLSLVLCPMSVKRGLASRDCNAKRLISAPPPYLRLRSWGQHHEEASTQCLFVRKTKWTPSKTIRPTPSTSTDHMQDKPTCQPYLLHRCSGQIAAVP